MSKVINARCYFNGDWLANRGLDEGGAVQMAIDNAVVRYSDPYVPFETGTLARSPYLAGLGTGFVTYRAPYARYLYYGAVMGPNIPVFEDNTGVPTRWYSPPGQKKHLTGKSLSYNTDGHPMAGPFWFDRMLAAHKEDVIEEARRVATGQ